MRVPDPVVVNGGRRISLAEIDAAVSERLGPTRITGNTKPAAFNRQVAMYLAQEVGGWSTTRIGKFYNGRDHSTVCYAVRRISILRQQYVAVDTLLTALTNDITALSNAPRTFPDPPPPNASPQKMLSWLSDDLLDFLVDRIASRIATRAHENNL